MSANREYQSLAVVVRFNRYENVDPANQISLKEALPSFDEADHEAERLNALVANQEDVFYFVLPVRFFPEGRDVEVGY